MTGFLAASLSEHRSNLLIENIDPLKTVFLCYIAHHQTLLTKKTNAKNIPHRRLASWASSTWRIKATGTSAVSGLVVG